MMRAWRPNCRRLRTTWANYFVYRLVSLVWERSSEIANNPSAWEPSSTWPLRSKLRPKNGRTSSS